MRKAQVIMNKHFYLGLSILDLSKTVVFEFWYDYVKLKMMKMWNCYMDTDSFIVHVKTDYIYKDIAEETRCGTSNFELDRPLLEGKNKKLIGLMKDKFGGQIMKKFVGLRVKTYKHLKDHNDRDKKSKRHKNFIK